MKKASAKALAFCFQKMDNPQKFFEKRNFAELGKASEEGDGVVTYVEPTESML